MGLLTVVFWNAYGPPYLLTQRLSTRLLSPVYYPPDSIYFPIWSLALLILLTPRLNPTKPTYQSPAIETLIDCCWTVSCLINNLSKLKSGLKSCLIACWIDASDNTLQARLQDCSCIWHCTVYYVIWEHECSLAEPCTEFVLFRNSDDFALSLWATARFGLGSYCSGRGIWQWSECNICYVSGCL